MAASNTAKLIIRSIPAGTDREPIVDFLCSYAKGAAREAVAARLEKLPLTLGNAIPVGIGTKMLASLQKLGADAMLVQDQADNTNNAAVTVAPVDQQPGPASVSELKTPVTRKTAIPTQPNPAAKTAPANKDIRVLVTLLLVIVAGLCVSTAVFLPSLQAASDPVLLLNKVLQKNADANNKTCPRNLNSHIRLDKFEAGNKKMTINYTLLEVNSTDVNGNELRPSVSRNIRGEVCKEEKSAELLKKGVAFVFAIHGKDGGLIFDYQVVHEDCDS